MASWKGTESKSRDFLRWDGASERPCRTSRRRAEDSRIWLMRTRGRARFRERARAVRKPSCIASEKSAARTPRRETEASTNVTRGGADEGDGVGDDVRDGVADGEDVMEGEGVGEREAPTEGVGVSEAEDEAEDEGVGDEPRDGVGVDDTDAVDEAEGADDGVAVAEDEGVGETLGGGSPDGSNMRNVSQSYRSSRADDERASPSARSEASKASLSSKRSRSCARAEQAPARTTTASARNRRTNSPRGEPRPPTRWRPARAVSTGPGASEWFSLSAGGLGAVVGGRGRAVRGRAA